MILALMPRINALFSINHKFENMKRIILSAAVATMMFASCQNENLVNQTADGRMFTLEVNQGMNSRTELNGMQTVWSEGDQIYVTSADGKTTGVLTLIGKGGEANGTFSGFVYGNGELRYSVYPVPTETGLNLGSTDARRLDAPMTGEINGGESTFINSCGLVKLNVLGLEEGDVVKVEADDMEIGSVLKYDLATNSWVKKTVGTTITVTGAQDATEFFVPVYTTNSTATDVTLEVSVNNGAAIGVTVPVAVKGVNAEAPVLAVTESGVSNIEEIPVDNSKYKYITATGTELENGKILYDAINKAEEGSYIFVSNGTYLGTDGQTSRHNATKNITIIGEDKTKTIIKGQKYGMVIQDSKDPNSKMNVTLKNLTIKTEHDWASALYVKYNIIVDVYDVILSSKGQTAILLDNCNIYDDGKYYTREDKFGTTVNAYNVTIDDNDLVEFNGNPCDAYPSEKLTYTYFNYEGGNINKCQPQSVSKGKDNHFVNGVCINPSK